MIIAVASGKGGTGKTTIAVSLALSLGVNSQFLDCDVEEPNAHIFLKPSIKYKSTAFIPIPQIDEEKCNFCRKCAEICAYNALAVVNNKVLVFPHLCHGCGGCRLLCPQKAITETDKDIGIVEIGQASKLRFGHGRLKVGEVMAPPLIREVKKKIDPAYNVIIDAPPGTSCPVVETIKQSDFCVLVTEPTPFGLNDLMLAVKVLEKLEIPFGVVINRADIGDQKVEQFCAEKNIPILMQIPFNREIAVAYSEGIPLIQVSPQYKNKFKLMFEKIIGLVR